MSEDQRHKLSLLILIIGLTMTFGLDNALGQTDDSLSPTLWQLENGWSYADGELVGTGAGQAIYKESCSAPSQTVTFDLLSLQGELQAQININGSNLYALSFKDNGDGYLNVSLARQDGLELTDVASAPPVAYDSARELHAEIVFLKGRIQAYLSEGSAQSSELMKIIDYYDPDSLPTGKVAFETQTDSMARLSNINIICKAQSSSPAKTPSLGVGFFKRPT